MPMISSTAVASPQCAPRAHLPGFGERTADIRHRVPPSWSSRRELLSRLQAEVCEMLQANQIL
jgi:hypothetical protein